MKRKFIRGGALILLLLTMLAFTLIVANLKGEIDSLACAMQNSFFGFAIAFPTVIVIAILAWEMFCITNWNKSLVHDVKSKAIKSANEQVVFECNHILNSKSFIGKYLFMSTAFAILMCILIGLTCSHGETCLFAFTQAFMLCMILMGINELYSLYYLHQCKYLMELSNELCLMEDYKKVKLDYDVLKKETDITFEKIRKVTLKLQKNMEGVHSSILAFLENIKRKNNDEQ